MPAPSETFAPLPPDDRSLDLAVARPNQDQSLPHIGLVVTLAQSWFPEKPQAADSRSSTCTFRPVADPASPSQLRGKLHRTRGRDRGDFPRTEDRGRSGPDCNGSIECSPSVQKRFLATGPHAVHLLTVRAGEVLHGSRSTRGQPYDTCSIARCRTGSRFHEEGEGTGSQVPYQTPEGGVISPRDWPQDSWPLIRFCEGL